MTRDPILRKPGPRPCGFALVVTISLLVLLAVVAIGLLSLSSIALRSAGREAARAEAQANARLALVLAIGDLQKELGPDQRVTAAARILEDHDAGSSGSSLAHPLWLGCWDSWQGWLNQQGIEETYSKGRESQFRRWLVSHPDPAALAAMDAVRQGVAGIDIDHIDLVQMVGAGTLGPGADDSLQVEAPLVPLDAGACAWWVGGENQKTRVATSDLPESEVDSLHRLSQWPGHGADMLDGLASLPDTLAALDKVPSLPSLGLAGEPPGDGLHERLRGHFHDLTVESAGLLTNVRKGGMKKDLNLLLENDRLPDEFGTYWLGNQGGNRIPIRPFTEDVPRGVFSGTVMGGQPVKPNFTVWYKLHQYYGLYRGANGPGDERNYDCRFIPYQRGLFGSKGPHVNFHWHRGNYDEYGYARTPMVSRLMMVFSTRRVEAKDEDGNSFDPKKYDFKLGFNPVLTIWNPYNATMHIPQLAMWLSPFNIQYKAYQDGTQLFDWKTATLAGVDKAVAQLNVVLKEGPKMRHDEPILLRPGETRIYSAPEDAVTEIHAGGNQMHVHLNPGYLPPQQGGGLDVPIDGLSGLEETNGIAPEIEIALRFSDSRKDFAGLGSAHQFYFILRNQFSQGQRFVEMAGNPIPDTMTMPIVPDVAGERVRYSDTDRRVPFAVVEYVLKNGEDLINPAIKDADGVDLPNVDYRCRSFIHANPVNQRHCHGEATDRAKAMDQYFVHVAAGSGNSLNPDFDPATNRAYHGSALSLNGGTWPGQPLALTTELPAVPVTSIASLMHFKLSPGIVSFSSRNQSWDVSPNQMLGIGNSFAHPLIPANDVYQDVPDLQERIGGRQFYMERDVYDHAFFNNDALWDDWFCSTIARRDQGVFAESRDLTGVARDFINGTSLLPNPHLRPWPGALSAEELPDVFVNAGAPAPEAWMRAASHLVLDGAFNVNSTSVEAWKALLYGLQDETIRYLDPESGELRQASLPEGRVILSRFTLPCSPDEGANAGDPASWLGIRMLTDPQIDRLAEECVRQVKLRGPFLNLSDFVNRRLENSELGLSGALQAAIDWDEFGGNSPDSGAADSINGRFKTAGDLIPLNALQYNPHEGIFDGNPAMPLPEAGTGSRFAGIPGYVTQADLLKRLGNMLTPRDDTFRIRAYGEARDAAGKVTARAWCEAVVQRTPDYMDPADEPHVAADDLQSPLNLNFGRRLRLVSFRWLGKEEV